MKAFIYFIIFCLSVFMYSCNMCTGEEGPSFYISAQIDGSNFYTSNISGSYANKGYELNGSRDNTTITISSPESPAGSTIPHVTTTGIYQIKSSDAVNTLTATDAPIFISTAIINGVSGYQATSGNMVITDLTDYHMQGTFTMELNNATTNQNISITDGKFYITLR